MKKEIWFDMDGTIADLYGVENWLVYLQNQETYPYENAVPMFNFSLFARLLNKLQAQGWKIGIISWTSKSGDELYNSLVTTAKMNWLAQHLRSVEWDEIKIVRYGTNKWELCKGGILFDDELKNREDWQEVAYTPDMIFEVLKGLRD